MQVGKAVINLCKFITAFAHGYREIVEKLRVTAKNGFHIRNQRQKLHY